VVVVVVVVSPPTPASPILPFVVGAAGRPDFVLNGFLSVGFQTDQKFSGKYGKCNRAWFSRIARILSVGWLFCAFHVQYMALYGGERDVRWLWA
jgi:hypothetical protein